MDNKPSELSKPAAFIVRSPRGDVAYRTISQTDADYIAQKGYASEPLYSQEYVSALEKRIAEFETEEARRKLIRDTWNNIPAWKPLKHSGRGA
ncbi:hypothetical protein [Serratia entomophila]|uniref:hypothetical protein n=1 Tax=Serratia entomophila TaxID=42906 RepID=UPI002178796F|nr:hypothetical protein [Serratia entomophila]CAI2057184.1 Uncharacterised protein [Serratia entomophila]